jgi:hypothetical protein
VKYLREFGGVEVAAAHDRHHASAPELVAKLERGRKRGGPGTFGEIVRGPEGQADSFDEFIFAQGHDVVQFPRAMRFNHS